MVKYYKIEMPEQTVVDVANACDIASRLMSGDLSVVMDAIEKAYFRRINKPLPKITRRRTMDFLRKFVEIGWDVPNGYKLTNDDARVLVDVADVLRYESGRLNETALIDAPTHNASRELIRVVGVQTLKHKRRIKK